MQKVFIGGAPKAGTTYLFNLLSSTDSFNCSRPKETFFYIDKDYPLLNKQFNIHNQSDESFLRFFNKNIIKGSLPLLEATTHLLYQRDILSHLKKNPHDKYIFLLRQPAWRIKSAFHFTVNENAILNQNVSFSQYVEALLEHDVSLINSWVRRSVKYNFLYQELSFSNYYHHLNYWLNEIDINNIKILLFEELKESPCNTLNNVFEFLGIDRINEGKYNEVDKFSSKVIKNKRIHYFARNIGANIPSTNIKKILKKYYYHFQADDLREENISNAVGQLNNYFYESNKKLQYLTGLDLSIWDSTLND